ncbi:MAG: endolytic transglycosylase MltG [Coriobacteriia bacterium]|nr:endolytic transglycosylase MltG [Coriobacteriia bacterium]
MAAILSLVLVAVLAVALIAWLGFFRPESSLAAGTNVTVTISSGSSTSEIARVLASSGVVANSNMFLWRVRQMNAGSDLKSGTYQLAAKMPYELVIDRLKAGPEKVVLDTITVTIPEGFRLKDVAARVESKLGIPAADFLALASKGAEKFSAKHPAVKGAYGGSLEGFLFPKTYEFERSATATAVIETMLAQFDKEVAQVDMTAANKAGYSLSQIVTMASIIEKETKLDEERPLVSSVIYNRLALKWKLQMCSTVQILLPAEKFRLSDQDLKIVSPYNTYLNNGLPPGPIANPGLASLKAAANPAKSDYLYYVLTGKDGSQTFASNDKDFQAAKKKSLEVFGQ